MSSLGATLAAAREARGATASEVAAATNIKVQHIEAIERDDFAPFAAPAYARGFIRIYADHVGVDPGPLVAEYRAAHESPPAVSPPRVLNQASLAMSEEPGAGGDAASNDAGTPAGFEPGLDTRSVVRVAIGVFCIVVVVLVLTHLFRGDRADSSRPGAGDAGETAGEPLLIEGPPPPYLDPGDVP